MLPFLVIVGVIVALRVVAGMLTSDEPEPSAPAALPPPPRKPARRRGPPRIPAPTFAETVRRPELAPGADGEVAVHPLATRAQPPPASAARPRLAAFLRGRAAQRQAFIAGEVLGRPLSLR